MQSNLNKTSMQHFGNGSLLHTTNEERKEREREKDDDSNLWRDVPIGPKVGHLCR